jgi:hypothetical protein
MTDSSGVETEPDASRNRVEGPPWRLFCATKGD